MPKGTIHLTKINADPDLYSVTFENDERARVGQAARTFRRAGERDEFLQQAGVSSDRIQPVMRDLRDGNATIGPVTFSDRNLLDLGSTTVSGATKEPD